MSTVLVVDARTDNRTRLEALIREAGHRALSATNGAEALETARREAMDLVLAGLSMPDMDGLELCRCLKRDEGLKRIPFLLCADPAADPHTVARLPDQMGGVLHDRSSTRDGRLIVIP